MAKTNTIIEAVPHLPEADSFDFHRSWMGVKHACGAHKMVIVLTCVLTILLTGFYVKFWPPVFIAQVALAGESDKDRSRENFYNSWAVFRNDALTDEAVVMTSAPVLAEVVDNLSPSGPLFTACAGAAQLAKTNVLTFINAVVTGAAGLAAMPIIPGL